MQSLHNIFANQKNITGGEEADFESTVEVIKFSSGEVNYLVPILSVREISDAAKIIPYPIKVPGCIGIASLRGEILPVASLHDKGSGDRLVVLQVAQDKSLAIQATGVKKVILNQKDFNNQKVLKIDGQAARVLDLAELAQSVPTGEL